MKPSSYLSFILATFAYALLLSGLYWLWNNPQPAVKTDLQKTVPVSLSMFQETAEPPKKLVETLVTEPVKPRIKSVEKPIEKIVKPITKPKSESKTQPKIKPATKPKPLPEPKQISKSLEKNIIDKPVINKELTVVKKTETAKPVEKSAVTKQPAAKPQEKAVAVKRLTANQNYLTEQAYLAELRQEIMSHASDTYPRRAKRRQWQGQVLIQLLILPNGHISQLKIVRGSKYAILDQAAMEIFTLKMQNRFKAFPKDIERQRWVIKVPVNYRLN